MLLLPLVFRLELIPCIVFLSAAWCLLPVIRVDPAASAGRGFVSKISDFGLSRHMGGQSTIETKTYGEC